MPESTLRNRIQYPVASDSIKASGDPSKLASDFKSLALTADVAISAAEAAARNQAIATAAYDASDKSNTALSQAKAYSHAEIESVSLSVASHEARIKAVETLGALGPGDVSDATMADIAANPATQFAGFMGENFTRRDSVYADPRGFGAVGDGVADDTVALQAWLDAPGRVRRLNDGVYRITSGLFTSEAGRELFTDGATIVADNPGTIAVTCTGADSRLRLNIVGLSKSRAGVLIEAGGCDASGSDVRNFHSSSASSWGIRAETSLGFTCVGAKVYNIHSDGNDVVGDDNGAARGILLTSAAAATQPSLIADNDIREITGEEGDGLHVIFYDGTPKFLTGMTDVRGNRLLNCSRRAIKVQSSGNTIEKNRYRDTMLTTGVEHAAMYVLNSDHNTVRGNDIDGSRFTHAYLITSDTAELTGIGNVVEGNRGKAGPLATSVFTVNRQANGQLSGNHADGGKLGFSLGYVVASSFTGNTEEGGTDAVNGVGFNITGNCDAMYVADNVSLSGQRRASMRTGCTNSVVGPNSSLLDTAGNFQIVGSSSGTIFRGHTARSSFSTLENIGALQTHEGATNHGTTGFGGVGVASVIFVRNIPTIERPTLPHTRGTLALNTLLTAGGVLGWACTGSGTPGTWKPVGTVGA